ncbi:MAG: hypothetical protein F6J94_12555 [Moorea sp. SIO1F2]|uniref:hypothetical protein n=1 Tax=unclassified Moorena TaxID=2683338 RepID=UPI0013BC8EF7|nr:MULTISPECIES: hypothetical protein [unclassified Moorena]NEO09707.1 hypothetical protein [Moorena sp. SIO3I8]NEO19329.1 hypothetical protein [Moorena sp. SIO4A5]NEP20566.1 hypothetical protein [Moorena sp. SIO3I6]NEQ59733.1 hypothetical protein [Moorena sp. SIO4A1]NET82721.1 hypothetical protein [Moorena sp. SIO1F2]
MPFRLNFIILDQWLSPEQWSLDKPSQEVLNLDNKQILSISVSYRERDFKGYSSSTASALRENLQRYEGIRVSSTLGLYPPIHNARYEPLRERKLESSEIIFRANP